jgi:transcription elongation factor GreA
LLQKIRFTKEGHKKLQDELLELKAQRPAVVDDLKRAREMGDLKENGFYKASRQKLNSIDSRITRVTYYLKVAEIVEETIGNVVNIGSKVKLERSGKEYNFEIVGDLEADPSLGRLSLTSPIGRAIEGKAVKDTVVVKTPAGETEYVIREIK